MPDPLDSVAMRRWLSQQPVIGDVELPTVKRAHDDRGLRYRETPNALIMRRQWPRDQGE